MDIRLYEGDIFRNTGGAYEYIEGIEELVQRVRMTVSIPKSSAVCPFGAGALLCSIDEKSDRAKSTAKMLIEETLVDVRGAEVEVQALWRDDKGDLNLKLRLTYNGVYSDLEVTAGNADL